MSKLASLRFAILGVIGLAVLPEPALAQQRPSSAEGFPIGNAGSVCEAQGVSLRGARASIFDVTNGLFIQNTGTGTAYSDRRGFTAGGISITTSSAATQISINGQILENAGNALTGLNTVGSLTINDVTGNFGGLFDPFSTVNGCVIGANCNFSEGTEGFDLSEPGINEPLSPEGTDSNSLELPIVDVVENDTEGSPPLVDEPVTGVGNDDLWQKECAEGEKCEA